MSLSICMITADPPARVAAVLDPVRPYAEEIVIAVDSRVDDNTLIKYGAIADKLFKIEFVLAERHLAWLYAQCTGDWILRLDGDEVPSHALVKRLPEMLASRDVRQFWIKRAWLYPDSECVLDEMPWSEDFVNRLTRNDGTLRISGRQHSDPEAVTQREYIPEPLYHLDLLTSSYKRRLDKVVRYETALPCLSAAGGGRINEAFYLPELRESLELHPTPAEDRARIALVLDGSPPPISVASAARVPFVSLEEMDRMWEQREVREGAYRANIELLSSTLSMAPSERRHVLVRVRNEGCERWPASLDEKPQIRLSYRWLHADGSVHTPEGPRSAFPRIVEPEAQILAPLHVDAPIVEGDYVLEIDLVHEEVRWFGCACRVPVKIAHPQWRPAAIRLHKTEPPHTGDRTGVRIPNTIHRVWLGGLPMPEEHERLGRTFAQYHPDWEMRLWTEDDLPELGIDPTQRSRARTPAELANVVRYEVLHRYGGVYVDTDVECRRPLTPLLHGIDAFAALEAPGRIGTAVLGSIPGHSVFERAARLARQTLGIYEPRAASTNGAYFLSLIVEQEQNMTIFEAPVFYPFLWDELERRHEDFPDAYAVHYWTLSWLAKDRSV
jgi:inositol phosphorylceramide mannosyltransferase catalytic subunit